MDYIPVGTKIGPVYLADDQQNHDWSFLRMPLVCVCGTDAFRLVVFRKTPRYTTVFFENGYSSDRSKNFLTISTVTLDEQDELALRIYNDRVLEACHHGGRTRHKNRRTTSRRRHQSLGMQFVMDVGDCSRSIPFHSIPSTCIDLQQCDKHLL
jgi:hypothetical protein